MRTVVGTELCRRVDIGLTRAGGYKAVVNSPWPVACSLQTAYILGIAQSRSMAHQLVLPS
jgi:hypothetical protein